MIQVNVHEAKTQLSKLLGRVESGEEIVIARAGKPVAKLVRHEPGPSGPRKPGAMKGKIVIHDNFDDPLPDEVARAFGMID
ncbi:MAG: type II toxin-antitoxin system Phd/YefM family antitoxin [Solirubrobacteraceae bacterium]